MKLRPKNLITERKTFVFNPNSDITEYKISFDTSEVIGDFSVSGITVSTIRSKPVYYCINKNTGYNEEYSGWYRLDDVTEMRYTNSENISVIITDITLYPADYEKNIENL